MNNCKAIAALSDNELLARLHQLRRQENETLLEILRHLNEVEKRKLHLTLGHGSLFDYCTRHLKYSESAAFRRIHAARCIRRFRAVERLLESGELSLSTVATLASVLNEGNVEDVVAQVRGMPRREVETLVANYKPPVHLRDRVQPVRVVVPVKDLGENHLRGGGKEVATSPPEPVTEPREDGLTKEAPTTPRTQSKLFIQFLASPEFMQKYEEAAALLSNKVGKLSMEAVLTELLEEFLKKHSPQERQARREERETARTQNASGSPSPQTGSVRVRDATVDSKQISARNRDAVFVRDNARCAFVGVTGKQCEETRNLHVDHVRPVARSGTSEPGNLRLLCARHNQVEADRILGRSLMDRYRHEHR